MADRADWTTPWHVTEDRADSFAQPELDIIIAFMDMNSVRLGDARFSKIQQWIPGHYSSIRIAIFTPIKSSALSIPAWEMEVSKDLRPATHNRTFTNGSNAKKNPA